MNFSSFNYNLRQGLKNIWRNKMFSLASVATMTACIFLFGLFYAVSMNFGGMLKNAEKGVAVTVYFDNNATQTQIDKIGTAISKRKEVRTYKFVTADEAWKEFQKSYFGNHKDAAKSFADDNPLKDMANYEIYLKDVSKQAKLVKYLSSLEGVREVHQSASTARTLTDFNALVRLISMGIVLVLVAVAVFLISNTITVGISVRKEEIAIMKLIGAKDSFVREPFIVEGVTIGLIGSIIPLLLLYTLYGRIIRYVATRFDALSNMFSFTPIGSIFRVLVPVSLILGVGIGYVGSRLTLKKHLHV
ncbi:permease-like cell division protein FtsX [Candidatus Weimeria sp. HCP3S3_B5]|uniref:permease-like cell division protein FtsX n=1 Tax=Candidatus Weimeria sp. HCP3S3_B5 TaxID=3438871 RepID=UPI002A9295D5|nr:permease-like cell division protein FtsX [Lachnospiraceae bacterium]MDY6352909.1 permease-like cell division protein FtsX [Lachnospiraceae bacterium]